jgi:hypothetical protein
MHLTSSIATLAAVVISYPASTIAQTYTECDPLTSGRDPDHFANGHDAYRTTGGCPADTALGKSVSIDFTSGASSSFQPHGAVTYGSNGAEFTVAQSGNSPLIQSDWYIMFGHVDYEIKAAPGAGIVSSAVLQSDCLDEIDWEWLGGDDAHVQSNYFGKGITTSYNRGASHDAPNNHDQFHIYSIDWTSEQIVWQIDGVTVRAMTYAEAATGQYPQTPMFIKVGSWSGGDPSNAPGTIQWAGGPTNYAAGPYTMYLKSIAVTDYSTGSQYTYSGTSGTWQSIRSNGGKINGNGTPENSVPTIAAPAVPTITSPTTNTAPMPFEGTHADTTSSFVTPSIYPWIGSATATLETAISSAITTTISGLPSGWTVNSSGKVVPPSAASTVMPSIYLIVISLIASLAISS